MAMELLSMDLNVDGESRYRIRVGDDVKYVSIRPGVYDFVNVLSFPPVLLEQLPPFPSGDWTTMNVSRTGPPRSGKIEASVSSEPLPAVTTVWHHNKVDCLSLALIARFKDRTYEVEYDGKPAVAKIARFGFEIGVVENETFIYSILEQHKHRICKYVPDFLGHIVENGRVIGLLLEKVKGKPANIQDLGICEAAVECLHEIGILHGDLNRFNFIVDRECGRVRLIDFEKAKGLERFSSVQAKKELERLDGHLTGQMA